MDTSEKKKLNEDAVPALQFMRSLRKQPKTFGSMLSSLRWCDEVSQVWLAKKLRMSPGHLCDIEKGRRGVSLKKAAQMARVLGYSETRFCEQAIRDQLSKDKLKMSVVVSESER